MELKIHWPHLNLHPRTNLCPDSKNEHSPASETKGRGSLGFGEVDFTEQLQRQQETEQKVKKTAFRSFLLGGISCAAAGISTAAGITASAIVSAGASLVFVIGGIAAFALRHSEKKSQTPPTNFMGLGQKEHGVPELNTMVPNHSVLVSENGQESTFWKQELINNAKQSIELTGNFCGGKAFCDALESIRSNMRRNDVLKAHLISSPDFLHKEDLALMEEIRKEFPDRFHYLLTDRKTEFFPRFQSVENHVKLLIVDEQFFVVGGTGLREALNNKADGTDQDNGLWRNFAERIFPRYWRDSDIVGKGNIAKTLRLEFFKLYAMYSYRMKQDRALVNRFFHLDPNRETAHIDTFETHPKKIDQVSIKALVGSPKNSENAITNEYCQLLKNARPWEEVCIGNMLFNPAPKLYDAIGDAVKRGVKVKVITNGIHSDTSKINHLFCWPNRVRYYPLMKLAKNKNLKIYEFHVPDAKYHAKTWVVGSKSIFSSYNWGKKSHYADDEIALVVESEKVAQATRRLFGKDKDLSVKISENEARRWQGIYGILGRIENALTASNWG